MTFYLQYVIFVLGAYLLGSIPTSIWVGKFFFHTDIRNHGSGNAGATNTIRVFGWTAGVPVLLFDIFKGWLAVHLAVFSHLYSPGSAPFVTFQIFLGIAAALGHIFPAFAGFRGGKGVATLLGVAIGINPLATLVCIGVFFVTLFISNYVSLSSIMAGITYPVSVIVIFRIHILSLTIFSIIIAIVLVITHHKNIARILRHEESKATSLLKRKNKGPTS
ncbi:MAG: glycerol-3-phosphate 1-O-acyltransferase PlsY [Chlorobi bacterium]|nr:glycerol-3-phosphate 1-O-acyltransferase PlsY [Chlorobiota bacterium]